MSDNVGDKIRKWVDELEETTKKSEKRATVLGRTCAEQALHMEQLADEFGKSRAEVRQLKNQLKEARDEASKLRELLARQTGGKLGIEGQNEENGKDAMAVFPEEVWSMIFGYLREPQDLKSCYQTCTKFMWMLQDERKNFLLMDVLKVLQQERVEGFDLKSWTRDSSKLPTCRLVCYGWKQSVDQFLQECSPVLRNVSTFRYFATSQIALCFTPSNNPWNDAALRNLSPDMNPIPSRRLLCCEIGRYTRLEHDVLELLERFGAHVWILTMSFANPVLFCYTTLVTCLEMMPNLKGLNLYRCIGTSFTPHLKSLIGQNPFPNIPTLKDVTSVDSPNLLLKSILTANPQIERLKIDHAGSKDDRDEFDVASFKLEQLKELHYDDIRCKELASSSWNLHKLSFGNLGLEWSELFQILGRKFGGTLVEMNLRLWGPNPDPKLRLNMPRLRSLKLEIVKCFNSVDFILPLINLEYLTVDMTHMSAYTVGCYVPIADIVETIKFHGHTHSLKDSNIWRLFPKLKKVSARTDRNERIPYRPFGPRRYDDETQVVDCEWQHCSRNQVDI